MSVFIFCITFQCDLLASIRKGLLMFDLSDKLYYLYILSVSGSVCDAIESYCTFNFIKIFVMCVERISVLEVEGCLCK